MILSTVQSIWSNSVIRVSVPGRLTSGAVTRVNSSVPHQTLSTFQTKVVILTSFSITLKVSKVDDSWTAFLPSKEFVASSIRVWLVPLRVAVVLRVPNLRHAPHVFGFVRITAELAPCARLSCDFQLTRKHIQKTRGGWVLRMAQKD